MLSPTRRSSAQPPIALYKRQPRGLRHPPLRKKEIQEFTGQRSKISDAASFGEGEIISHSLIFRIKWTTISGRIII